MPCFTECERRGIQVHVAGVFASGLLVGGSSYAYKQAPDEKRELAARWRALAAEHGVSLPAVAIAFAAMPKCVTRVVLGVASPEQVHQNVAWVQEAGSVPPQLWRDAHRRGLLAPEVPVPA
jgi:D-threo-aldose 1-dehydrogenase